MSSKDMKVCRIVWTHHDFHLKCYHPHNKIMTLFCKFHIATMTAFQTLCTRLACQHVVLSLLNLRIPIKWEGTGGSELKTTHFTPCQWFLLFLLFLTLQNLLQCCIQIHISPSCPLFSQVSHRRPAPLLPGSCPSPSPT